MNMLCNPRKKFANPKLLHRARKLRRRLVHDTTLNVQQRQMKVFGRFSSMQHARLYYPRRVGMEEGKEGQESARSCNAVSLSAAIGQMEKGNT